MAHSYFNQGKVLDYLDNCVIHNPGCFFMDLGHGYFHTANSRLSLFADERNWAIVFEKSGYNNRGYRIELELNYFGSKLHRLEPGGLYHQFAYNSRYLNLVGGENLRAVETGFEEVSPDAQEIELRDAYVTLPDDWEGYRKWVPGLEGPAVQFKDLARYLAYEYEPICRATDAELRFSLPEGLPLVMQIDSWHHRHYYYYVNGNDRQIMGDKPSSYETFRLIADVLVTRDPLRFQPTLPANNHWVHWPEAGGL